MIRNEGRKKTLPFHRVNACSAHVSDRNSEKFVLYLNTKKN